MVRQRKTICILLLLAAMLVLFTACAAKEYDDPYIEYEVNGDVAAVVWADSYVEDVVIQPTYQRKPVTSIADSVFENHEALKSIELPDSLVEIGDYAFYYCTALETIVLPEGVEYVGDNAFEGCELLSSVSLPQSLSSIGYRAFHGCNALTAIELPCAAIGDYAFEYCAALRSVNCPADVLSFGTAAFANCESLEEIILPADSATVIDMNIADNAALFTVETALLSQAVADGRAGINILPRSIDVFLLDVTNNTDDTLLLECDLVESGYFLSSNSQSYQNLLITSMDDDFLQLEPGETVTCGGDCACMNISRGIPDESCGYTLAALDNAVLAKLNRLFEEEYASYAVRQAAVWIVTDGTDEYDVQTLVASYSDGTTEALISAEDYAIALELVSRAREM